MFRFSKLVLAGLTLGIGLLVAGCASNATAEKSATTPLAVRGGMYCPKCETVWVSEMVGQGTKVARLRSRREMTCPTCDAMAASYLADEGKAVLHECPECKVTLVPVRPAPEALHPKGTHS